MENFSAAQVTQDAWDRASETLRDVVGVREHQVWIATIQFERFDVEARRLILSVPNDFQQRWVSRKYAEQIRAACSEAFGSDVELELTVEGNSTVDEAEAGGVAPAPALRPRGSAPDSVGPTVLTSRRTAPTPGTDTARTGPQFPRLNPRHTFDEFVVGESNRYAHAAAMAVADPSDSNSFNPLFLYSASGLGKTHLMQAIGHAYLQRNPGATVVYSPSEQFVNAFIESIQHKKQIDFRNQYRNIDLLLLDDVQFLVGKERTQYEVFHTFNSLFDNGKRIVLTSDRPPKELATLQERLRSRFEWGVIADMQPPDLETRIAILRYKAEAAGLAIPDEVHGYIAEWVRSNVRELEGALNRIKVYARLHNCPITMDVCREVLSHLLVGQPQNRVTVEDIQRSVCDYFQVTTQQLLGRNRSKKFSQPRHLVLYLCRELTDLSFPDIAQKFGGKDHTSVIYAYRKIKKAIDDDPVMANVVNHLTRQIQSGQPE